jgi:hypothetical protein
MTDVARATGWDDETLRRDVMLGLIPGAFQIKPGGKWRFKTSALEKWWAELGAQK